MSMLQTRLVWFNCSNNCHAIDVNMDRSAFNENSSLKILRLVFSWGSFFVSNAKTTSVKIEALTRSLEFLSSKAALWSYMEYLGCLTRYLFTSEIVNQIKNRNELYDCWSYTNRFTWRASPSSKCSQPLNFSKYYFGTCSYVLTELILVPYSCGWTS